MLDEHGNLSDQKDSFYLSLATEPNVFYNTIDMTTDTQTKGNETMTTKIVGIAVAVAVGAVVASNLISMFSQITTTLSTAISY